MKNFTYKPRSLRDQAVRTVQTHDEVDKAPRVSPEELCARPGCGHPRWCHCDVRRTRATRTVLFYARYRLAGDSEQKILWQRVHAYNIRLSGYSLAVCKHFTEDQPGWPCCSSSSCTLRDCSCMSFVSPYRKPRKPAAKKATGTTGAPKREKAEPAQIELFEGV